MRNVLLENLYEIYKLVDKNNFKISIDEGRALFEDYLNDAFFPRDGIDYKIDGIDFIYLSYFWGNLTLEEREYCREQVKNCVYKNGIALHNAYLEKDENKFKKIISEYINKKTLFLKKIL